MTQSAEMMLDLADRAEGCLNSRNSAYPSDVLRDCIIALRAASSPTADGRGLADDLTGMIMIAEDDRCSSEALGISIRNSLPFYYKIVAALRNPLVSGEGKAVAEQCAKIADQTALRCVREKIRGDSVARFIAQNIRNEVLLDPVSTSHDTAGAGTNSDV